MQGGGRNRACLGVSGLCPRGKHHHLFAWVPSVTLISHLSWWPQSYSDKEQGFGNEPNLGSVPKLAAFLLCDLGKSLYLSEFVPFHLQSGFNESTHPSLFPFPWDTSSKDSSRESFQVISVASPCTGYFVHACPCVRVQWDARASGAQCRLTLWRLVFQLLKQLWSSLLLVSRSFGKVSQESPQ